MAETDAGRGSGAGRPARLLRALRETFLQPPRKPPPADGGVHEKFRVFTRLLDRNGEILQLIADLEEKSRGEYLFDTTYITEAVGNLERATGEMVADLVAIGGKKYVPLRDRCRDVHEQIRALLSGPGRASEDRLSLELAEVDGSRAWSVGGKTAQLGELRARLSIPVPDGFAVTAWAAHLFLTQNGLENRIDDHLRGLDIGSFAELEAASRQIRSWIADRPLPLELEEAIRGQVEGLRRRTGADRLAVRSSALGEDSELSFAGHYVTLLNVPADEVVDAYRQVIAGKFTPQAIYAMLSHSLTAADMPMAVGCLEMIDASASGVVYTRDPVQPESDSLLIHAVWGLGPLLVGGTVVPDLLRVSRESLAVTERRPGEQTVQLRTAPGSGLVELAVPEKDRGAAAIGERQAGRLARLALKVEKHCGSPRDIEWALTGKDRLVLLQSRPLRVLKQHPREECPPQVNARVLIDRATIACPGCGGGHVYTVAGEHDLEGVPTGAVLSAPRPFPGLVTVMGRVAAIIIGVGSAASHVATMAREYCVPMLVGRRLPDDVADGDEVTVDASRGIVYSGLIGPLLEACRDSVDLLEEEPIFVLLRRVLSRVAPLHLLHPSTPDFTVENCRTVHDITRFAHQRAMEELFAAAQGSQRAGTTGIRLKSTLPLPVTIIHLEEELTSRSRRRGGVPRDQLRCPPMESFWGGMEEEGWPRPPEVDVRGFVSVMATHMMAGQSAEFEERSFAILTRTYMLVSLRMGYHFTTVESMCSEEAGRNFIRMQYKEGGAQIDRRMRRIRLISSILSSLGFSCSTAGDFLDATLAYEEPGPIRETLYRLGRLNILTKQLDMALSNDSVAEWYRREIAGKLGLGENREG